MFFFSTSDWLPKRCSMKIITPSKQEFANQQDIQVSRVLNVLGPIKNTDIASSMGQVYEYMRATIPHIRGAHNKYDQAVEKDY
jgi:hypothetical protein